MQLVLVYGDFKGMLPFKKEKVQLSKSKSMQWNIIGAVISDKRKWRHRHFSAHIYPSRTCTVHRLLFLATKQLHCEENKLNTLLNFLSRTKLFTILILIHRSVLIITTVPFGNLSTQNEGIGWGLIWWITLRSGYWAERWSWFNDGL